MSSRNYVVSLSPEANNDLIGITQYGELEWGEDAAQNYTAELIDSIRHLATFLRFGRRVDAFQIEIRAVICGTHVIYYRVDEYRASVHAVRILHARMDAFSHLTELEEA